jgi:hypothetical protein
VGEAPLVADARGYGPRPYDARPMTDFQVIVRRAAGSLPAPWLPTQGKPSKRVSLVPAAPVAPVVFRRRVLPAGDGYHFHAVGGGRAARRLLPTALGQGVNEKGRVK